MPFLKPQKCSISKMRIEASKRNGLRHAIFTPCLQSKEKYIGEWKDDKKHGKGSELELQNCLVYEGDWFNNQKHGYGVLSKILKNKQSRKIYSGHWVKGKKQGFGGFWYENDGYYEGGFLSNKRHGFGRMWSNDGTFYQGSWKDDMFHGEGMLVLANGNRFEGNFSRGKKEGRGIFYHMKTGQLQEGYWSSDTCIVSTMEDIYWRQSAAKPTQYPIPKVKVKNFEDIIETQINHGFLVWDRADSSSLTNYQDYAQKKIDCL